MPAYLISHVGDIADQARYAAYIAAVTPLVEKFSGRMLADGQGAAILEGAFDVHHIVVFEFPAMSDISDLWNSPEYQSAKALREGIALTNAVALPGI